MMQVNRPRKSYLICTLPRSGSWLLCNLLRCSGVAGKPAEHFHAEILRLAGRRTARHHVRQAIRPGTVPNGVFGAKIHWSQFELLAKSPDARGTARLAAILAEELREPTYVWLMRRDKARQAISYYRAIHTRSWWRLKDGEETGKHPEPPYDFDSINRYEEQLIKQESAWQAYFEGFNFDPEVITYEELSEDPAAAVTQVLQSIGVSADPARIAEPDISRQADATSAKWLERYLATKSARVRAAHSPRPPMASASTQRTTANQHEFRIAAIQRSGHHGVINWIAAQAVPPTLFLNDAQPGTNPFFTCTIASRFESQGRVIRLDRAHLAPYTPRSGLIHNYEDRALSSVFCEDFERHHDGWVGSSLKRVDVIVIRDVFNTFASRMPVQWIRHKLHNETQRLTLIALWKEYAREALGLTSSMRGSGVVILFNRWLVDPHYRQEIAESLGLAFNDAGFGKVSGQYGGSSFDGVRFDGRAATMSLVERWKHFVDDPLFCSIFTDRELIELSEMLFGHIPGTEVLSRVLATSFRPGQADGAAEGVPLGELTDAI
jgi:LPS sulfotransferase NodH